MERFLIVRPPHRLGFRVLDTQPASNSANADWRGLIGAMLDIPRDDEEQPLRLSTEARAVWMDARLEIEAQMRPGGALRHCTGWASKASGTILRLAGLFHLGQFSPGPITPDVMEKAVTLTGHFARHAADAFAPGEQAVRDALELVEVLRAHAGGSLTRTELRRRIKGREMATRQRMDAALQELEEHGYIQVFEQPTSGRPASLIRVRGGI